jgi:hypothetical protein
MEALHPNLYHATPKPVFQKAISDLESQVPSVSDDAVMVGVLRIVAMVSTDGRDGHTGVFVWGDGLYPVHSLPLRLWLFSDGLFVIDALPPYRSLIGARIERFGEHPTAAILRAIDPIVPRDNAWTVKLLDPRFLLIPEVLHGLGLIDAVGPVTLQLDQAGGERTVTVDPVPMSTYNGWAGAYGLHLVPRAGALYLSGNDRPLWFRFLPSSSTLYIQYNRVEFFAEALTGRLRAALARGDVVRTVVDIRQNYGGETNAVDDVLRLFRGRSVADRSLYVITGRNTFSAASLFAARMERTTDAIFVGEPMGGSPNLYANAGSVTLRYSGLLVSVATDWNVGSTPQDPRLTITPQILTPLSSSDYVAGHDPAMAAILARSGG